MPLPGLLKKYTDNERRPKILKTPAAKDRADDDSKKKQNKPSVIFMEKIIIWAGRHMYVLA